MHKDIPIVSRDDANFFDQFLGRPLKRFDDGFYFYEPETGELTHMLDFVGNFPIIDDDGLFQGFPDRVRRRRDVIRKGKLVPDPRPVEGFLEFQHNETTNEKLKRMLNNAEVQSSIRKELNRIRGGSVDDDFEDIDSDNDEFGPSLHEEEFDEDLKKPVSKGVKSLFKRKQKAPSPDKEAGSGDPALSQQAGGANSEPPKQE